LAKVDEELRKDSAGFYKVRKDVGDIVGKGSAEWAIEKMSDFETLTKPSLMREGRLTSF
jgi:hypothetical protein